jgi:hypothetical protein
MPISITKYVDITSGVGSAANFGTRDLIARIFSTNPLIPTSSVVSFESADEVLDYFGSSSVEYARAVFYFGWISKSITRPQRIDFARWASVATAPLIYGAKGAQALATWNAITSGAFTLELGGVSHTMSGMNFGAAASLSAVAGIIQAAIIAAGTGAMWDNATVVWNSTRQSFDFTGGATGTANIVVTAGGGGADIAEQLGWLSADTILSDGADAQTISDLLADSTEANNNFGSFTFMPTLTQDQIVEAAEWNDTQNNRYLYSVRCTSSNAAALSAALIDISGVTLTLAPLTTEFPEQVPMMIEAATKYESRNSVQNYMFQSFDLTPSVTTNADYTTYNDLRVNFYGNVQQAGVTRSFYQRGTMMGGTSDPVDQNVYVNEIWFKDALTVALMNLLLALPQIPASNVGRAQILTQLQGQIDIALFNGTIEAGKSLTDQQKLYIAGITGDENAWIQVQNAGYWVDAVIVQYVTPAGVTEYKAVYTLIYSKNDVIRFIEGSDILI